MLVVTQDARCETRKKNVIQPPKQRLARSSCAGRALDPGLARAFLSFDQQLLNLSALPTYSHLNATIGSTLDARRAGINAASVATEVSSKVAPNRVSGSDGLTPYSVVEI